VPDKSKLRNAWDNMQKRVRGVVCDGCHKPRWKGLEVGWSSYAEFKTWALANGYEDGLSLDRREGDKGYVPGNCQWITKRANDEKARNSHKPECQCFWCRRKVVHGVADAQF
jgi:hypothetical protein